MDNQRDELTDTGVIRFLDAQNLATARFIAHFTREADLPPPSALSKVA
jgi:hypothetical protein